MNFAALLGYVTAIIVVSFSIFTSVKDAKIFADVHGIVIVIGGTISVALMTFNFRRLFGAIKVLLKKMFGGTTDYIGTIQNIVDIANAYRVDTKGSLKVLNSESHPFLVEAMTLLVDYGFNGEELDSILTNAIRGKKKRDNDEGKVWHTISRFPPAFGLMGATLGMIAFLQTMGEPGSQDRIGPSMATALVATFYGLVVANFLLIPLAERLSELSNDDVTLRNIIKDGVLMVQEKKHPKYIEEYLKSYLAPAQRGSDFDEKK
jgi:chemotaxis protein MotA